MQSSSIHVSLPKALKTYVEAEAAKEGHRTVSGYLRYLIQEDQKRKLASLRREIEIGIREANSGDVAPLDGEAIKAKGRRILARRRGKG
jgi:Arc/MetJ-type ribon-helix-helix transcriptional regulator